MYSLAFAVNLMFANAYSNVSFSVQQQQQRESPLAAIFDPAVLAGQPTTTAVNSTGLNLPDLIRITSVAEWLAGIKMSQYATAFERANITNLVAVSRLTSQDLLTMGVTLAGHQKKILQSAATLRRHLEESTAAAAAASTNNSGPLSPLASPLGSMIFPPLPQIPPSAPPAMAAPLPPLQQQQLQQQQLQQHQQQQLHQLSSSHSAGSPSVIPSAPQPPNNTHGDGYLV